MRFSAARRVASALTLCFLLTAGAGTADAHATLRTSVPADASALDTSPPEIRLTFTEAIEPTLSRIRVVDSSGKTFVLHGRGVAGDTKTCTARLDPVPPGSYRVEWRVMSLDGHAISGSFRFAVRTPAAEVSPPDATPPRPVPVETPAPRASREEMAARWFFTIGIALLLGAAAAALGEFGGNTGAGLAAAGWLLASVGLLVLGDTQRRSAGASVAELLRTGIGHALLWRAAALAVAGAALAIVRHARRAAMSVIVVSATAAIGVHAAAGHAAAAESYAAVAVGVHWLHFVAAGVWLGGLAALLAGTRGDPAVAKTAAVRRYSSLAAIALAAVFVTGLLRSIQEVHSWEGLTTTNYGQAVLAKGALLVAIAALGALNRFRSVPAAATDLRPLRRFAAAELVLMLVILAVAAILATLPPPR